VSLSLASRFLGDRGFVRTTSKASRTTSPPHRYAGSSRRRGVQGAAGWISWVDRVAIRLAPARK
jgi:hypothetical protein